MNKFSFSIFNVIAVAAIIVFIILAVSPFDIFDIKQAQRIAKWKSQFENFKYCFSLVDINEGAIV